MTPRWQPALSRTALSLARRRILEWDETTDSPHFPHLTTQYRMHQIIVYVSGLPKGDFVSQHLVTHPEKQLLYWEWHKDSQSTEIRKDPDLELSELSVGSAGAPGAAWDGLRAVGVATIYMNLK